MIGPHKKFPLLSNFFSLLLLFLVKLLKKVLLSLQCTFSQDCSILLIMHQPIPRWLSSTLTDEILLSP